MPLLKKTKQKKLVPVPYDPENKYLSKGEFLAKRAKKNEIARKTREYERKLSEGEDIEPSSETEEISAITAMEQQLKGLVGEIAEKETLAESAKEEKAVEKLKKAATVLKRKITNAKKNVGKKQEAPKSEPVEDDGSSIEPE